MRILKYIFIIVFLTAACISPPNVSRNTTQNLSITPSPSNVSINETIIERLEEVRGLDLLFPVETVFIDKKELEKEYMERKEDKTDELILKALFMMDPDANLHLIESKYNSECVMAYYT
ncbi:MAG: hypothetical protein ACXQS7_03180, partial [Candidatus Syntropharchaeia archaeon]